MSRRPDMCSTDIHAPIQHLRPGYWARAHRLLLAKALAEFSHERLLQPNLQQVSAHGWSAELSSPDGRISYRFHARRYALNHWLVAPESVLKLQGGEPAIPDVLQFILEFQERLELGAEVLPIYLEELSSTLAACCFQLDHAAADADVLARADFQTIEAGMREGHPAFVANHGRVGFSLDDYQDYAPEAGQPLQLLWLAVHRQHARFDAIDGLSQIALLTQELGEAQLARFEQQLLTQGQSRDDYLLMPVHPWQWQHKIGPAYAADIACRHIILLGPGDDCYQAQQSIRTWFNRSHPRRAYVKTALSILNMGFMRGLSADYMRGTPAINQWLADLVGRDPVLRELRFGVLREIAAIGYRQPYYQQAGAAGAPYRKMLAALWRESPIGYLQPGQRLMTMAALLHIDIHGQALLATLVQASGLMAESWLNAYLQAYLSPLLHCFYAYGLVFMPHGENLILVLEQDTVRQVWIKDIGEEIAVLDARLGLPPAVQRIAVQVPPELQPLSIFTDIFDGYLRFLAPIMDVHLDFSEDRFWAAVAHCIHQYQQAHPEYTARFRHCDLFVAEFPHSCLNRLQLKNNRQMVDLADPAGSLQLAGRLTNPVAAHRPPSCP